MPGINDENPTSDERLRATVLQAFADEERLAPLDVRVGVLNAVAHLGGNAPSLETWALAEQIAASVPGVRGVVNRIETPGAPSPARTIHLDLSKMDQEG
jgi:osmotically-inducible protein OsmY